jgi:hypothetical protein
MSVIAAGIAAIQKPWMANVHIHVFWMPPIHGGMTGIIFCRA